MNRCLLLRESRKLLNERNFSFSRHLQRVKFNKEVHDRKKQETWADYVARLEPHERQELEFILRKRRRDFDENISLDPKNAMRNKPPNWMKSNDIIISGRKCRIIFVHNFIPFLGFGFLDNLIMIVAGNQIEAHFGIMFNCSVMFCAALGNTLSDAAGIFAGGWIEYAATRMGVPVPDLTRQEEDTFRARASKNGGQISGIIIGCLIGMFPLLFHEEHHEHDKNES